MNANRLAELLEACPELSMEDIERLKTFRPKRSLLWVSVKAALLEISMA